MNSISRSPVSPALPLSPSPPLKRATSWACRRQFVICIFLALVPSPAFAETLSMQEFMASRPKWNEWETSETTLRIEGRFEAASPRLIRMRKCPLAFEPALEDLPRLGQNVERVLITGRLDHRVEEQFFRVFSVEKLPSDRETYAIKAAAVDLSDGRDWHALADWASELGRFYEDEFLLDKAGEARRKGLTVERVRASGDLKALEALAGRAETFGEIDLSREIRHEALRLRWDEIREMPQADSSKFVEAIRKTLPGAIQPIAEWPMTLAAAYADQPVATYNRADDDEYNALDRLFLAEVLLAEIERRANDNGSNGEALATEIESVLPERTALAESYRLREIEYRIANIETATRDDALSLASSLEARGRAEDARRVLRRWLGVREAAAREDGPGGLISVAEDYLAVLKDNDGAARLLIEAAQANPDSEEIPKKLREIGYREIDGRWFSPEEIAARPVDPLAAAMREGRVTNGMNPQQVVKTLGKPERVARSASRTQVHAVWLYGGGSGLAIHFSRRTTAASSEAQVVGVTKWVGP